MSLARSTTLVALAALSASAAAQQPSAPAPPPAKPAFEVQIKTTEPVHVAVLPMKGSYMQHPDAFGRLGGYLRGRGSRRRDRRSDAISAIPPSVKRTCCGRSAFRSRRAITVEAPYEIKDLPAMQRFKGDMSEVEMLMPVKK